LIYSSETQNNKLSQLNKLL